MSSCFPVASETQFQFLTSTSQQVSTTFSTSVTTFPPTTSTSLSTICLASASSSSSAGCQSSTVSTVLVTNPGETSTVSVPVTVIVPVVFTTSAPTQTLFSTSCATSLPSSPTSSTASSTASPLPSSITSPSPSSSDSTTFTTSSSTTLPNGAVVVTSVVVTSVVPQSSVVVTSQPTPSLNQANANGKTSSKTAPIIGGVVGGVIALLAVIGGIWFIWRRSKRWNDLFDEDLDEKEERRTRMVLDSEDVNPRPYHYGLVGHSDTPSPPRSPLGSMDLGNSFSSSVVASNLPLSHSRSSSGGALSTGESMSRQIPTPAGHISRPYNLSTASSAAASTRPLLERPVNRPPNSWSVGGQNIGQDAPTHSRNLSSTVPRPNSAGATLPSPVTSPTTDPLPLTPPVMQRSAEKSRLLASLPPGAAAPAPPSTGEPVSPPPIRPRSAKRPSTAPSDNTVVVHRDAGPASSTTPRDVPPGSAANAPPAYSPT